jgi:beta-galactosidase
MHGRVTRLVVTLAAAAAMVASGLSVLKPETVYAASYTPPPLRQLIGLDAGWRFIRSSVPGSEEPGTDDSAWAKITVPHTWNAQDGQDGGTNYYRGVGWYRRHYTPPTGLAGRRLWLQFDGVNSVAEVWVNGSYLGQHKGGYARFRFDATSALRLGADNVIAVRVSNARDPDTPPLGADFTFFGGIYRDVSLVATDPLAVRMLDYAGPGVYLRQRSVTPTSAAVDVTTKVWNGSTGSRVVAVHAVVTDRAHNVVAEATSPPRAVAAGGGFQVVQPVQVANPRRWQGKADPYLYRVTVEVQDAATGTVVDAVSQPLGLRSIAVDPDTGLYLNGTHLALHGVNRHQDVLDRGTALTPADQIRDFDLMDEMGVNALRTAHYQQDQAVYDLADRRGYLVWTEIPLVNTISDTAAFRADTAQQLRELIRQNYNHPSIAFWGIGNEQVADDPATNSLLATLAGIAHTEDPDRFSTYAHSGSTTSKLADHSDVTGYNKYSGWYHDSVSDFGPLLDSLHASQPTRRIGISEYGAGASIFQHEADPTRPAPDGSFHPEEYQALFHEAYWRQIEARPYLWGTFVWNMFDFASDTRGEGDTLGRNDKGLVTYDRRTRKDAFYWYKANWTQTPFVYVTSRRWMDRIEPVTTVKVYGNVDSVTLTVNGIVLGPAKTSTDHIYLWPGVTLSPGTNTIVATGIRAGFAYTDTVTWILR